jgi:phosphohistidine phosphatase
MARPKQLFVLRHAKSSWDDPGLRDRDRPLAPRGRTAVKLLAAHVRAAGIHPALVLCSSARRARETLEGVDPGGELAIESELYTASVSELSDRLRRVPAAISSVMLIGHNPSLQLLVIRLAAGSDGLDAVRGKFPTGALATLTFQGPWSELGPGVAELTAYVRPKDLR